MADQAQPALKIVILETSDVHGFIVPYSYADGTKLDSGLARLAEVIRKERELAKEEEGAEVLLIDNGDCLQGSPLTYYQAKVDDSLPSAVLECMNYLRYDAAVPGNHEFNFGLDYLRRARAGSKFPWLSANIISERTGEPWFGTPYRIWELAGGVRVALLGLTTSYIPNWEQAEHIAGIQFDDPVETARRWVPYLRQQEEADLVIVSYHGGLERDPESGEPTEPQTGENRGYALCTEVPGIDVLLTGHQHRLLEGLEISGVSVVQPSSEGKYLGKVTVTLHKQHGVWMVVRKQSELRSCEDQAADFEILGRVAPAEEALQEWLDQPIGEVRGEMQIADTALARREKHPFVEWLNKVQLEVSGAELSCTSLFDEQAAGFGSTITMRDIITNYKYPNTLRVLKLCGADIKAALERSAAYFTLDPEGNIVVNPEFLYPKPQHFNYDMWEGIEYVLDISRPLGERVTRLLRNGVPMKPEEEFNVVMNNYRAGGGGDYFMFRDKPVVRDIPADMVEVLADYVRKTGVIDPVLTPSWSVTAGSRSKVL
ncbi:bifunctional metallophosphatase/5'-nucleotidase [Paenibacillus sp. CAA11]|uniref:bifunctional metallophosphatase/5'-nucleotidase n=1 Tax=Paenibacillus sp. CAA11 TaxID=1532905 RepID=UPI000D3B6C6D|nr:bifunctional metallophosphatase/5'-nucleotidase [Paenibacillus sp. CAA11]AWB43234.1 bifunctional metallophosphatase/5'-nucleotidase [Paenibacillus sp. CAA11]